MLIRHPLDKSLKDTPHTVFLIQALLPEPLPHAGSMLLATLGGAAAGGGRLAPACSRMRGQLAKLGKPKTAYGIQAAAPLGCDYSGALEATFEPHFEQR